MTDRSSAKLNEPPPPQAPPEAFQVAHALSHLRRFRLTPSRLHRFLESPLKLSLVQAARTLGVTIPVIVDLIWGDRFAGIFPEAVTTLIWRYGFHERLTSMFILNRLRQGQCFVDIGAHFGYFTILSSRIVGPDGCVVAIEPMPRTFGLLVRNVALNALGNVIPCEVAAFSEEDQIQFLDFGIIYSSLSTHSAARGWLQGREHEGEPVNIQAKRADKILIENDVRSVQMIKIDAESSEEDVLVGLSDTLERDFPITIVELGGKSDNDEENRVRRIFTFMGDRGYLGYNYDGESLGLISSPVDLPYMNVIFERKH